jgi:hypothetical protein
MEELFPTAKEVWRSKDISLHETAEGLFFVMIGGDRTELMSRSELRQKLGNIIDHLDGDRQDALFEEFWAVYPKKKGKAPAKAKWKRLKADEFLSRRIINHVKRLRETEWKSKIGTPDVQYIPNPETYINQKRWEDEILTTEETTNNGIDWDRYRAR